jgi:hypothetical protein
MLAISSTFQVAYAAASMPLWERAPTPAIQCDKWMMATEGVNLCLIVSAGFGITAEELLSLVC